MYVDKVFIYSVYDFNNYVNYYNLVINGEVVCEFIPEEGIEELFKQCDRFGISKSTTQWCVVQAEDASNWDYEEVIKSHGYELNPMIISTGALCEQMSKLFYNEFTVNEDEDTSKKVIRVLYPNIDSNDSLIDKKEKALEDAESILCKSGMTELAKIIREKYERINGYE